jgi:hypothetical protein
MSIFTTDPARAMITGQGRWWWPVPSAQDGSVINPRRDANEVARAR